MLPSDAQIRSTIRCNDFAPVPYRGLVLATAFAALGIWALAESRYATGAFWLVISIAWLLLALFRDKFVDARKRQSARLRS